MKDATYYARKKEDIKNAILANIEVYQMFYDELKKVERVKTKENKDFKILSKNFVGNVSNGRINITVCTTKSGYHSDWITLQETKTADEIEKDIQMRLENYKEHLQQLNSDLIDIDTNFELYVNTAAQVKKMLDNCKNYDYKRSIEDLTNNIIRFGL